MLRVPIKWLRQFVDLDALALSPKQIAGVLTMAGSEVERIRVIGGEWQNIVVAELVAINPHPNADRLKLATVDTGGERQTVVCGAPNLNLGDKVVYAGLGATLTNPYEGGTLKLKPAKIRGVASAGMIVSEKELGISDDHEGILVLPPAAPVGTTLSDYLGDTVLDFAVTPNRADCLSVLGIARELAALTDTKIRGKEPTYTEGDTKIEDKVSVEIKAADLCPRYCATLIEGVTIGESPQWLKDLLSASGQRPISNIVDITNYVMLAYGQPLHSFDFNEVRDGRIIVRRAAADEAVTSLDGVDRKLDAEMLVIADAERAVAVAGVMGGANSEVTPGTTSILLEAASFKPASIRRTSSLLGLPSEASMRFERGISADLTIPALKRATQMIQQFGGGTVARGIIDVYPGEVAPASIDITGARVKRHLGIGYSASQIDGALKRFGFSTEPIADGVRATAPYWRTDIRYPEDLIEEVARLYGYDRIPMTLLSGAIPQQSIAAGPEFRRQVSELLAGFGFLETVSFTMTGPTRLQALRPDATIGATPVELSNPMTEESMYLRTTLRANLLPVLAENCRHDAGGIRIFEAGKVYHADGDGPPRETDMVTALLTGSRDAGSWRAADDLIDFYDAKGLVEALLARLGVSVEFSQGDDAGLHPQVQAKLTAGGEYLGVVGELHPKVSGACEIENPVYLVEFDLAALLPHARQDARYQPVPRFPAVLRDLALVVDQTVTHIQVMKLIGQFPLVVRAEVFDVYAGKQVAAGKKSVAYRLHFQSPDKTLTDEAVNNVLKKLLGRLEKETGAELRS